jgi:hypothetical protein
LEWRPLFSNLTASGASKNFAAFGFSALVKLKLALLSDWLVATRIQLVNGAAMFVEVNT